MATFNVEIHWKKDLPPKIYEGLSDIDKAVPAFGVYYGSPDKFWHYFTWDQIYQVIIEEKP